MIGSYRYVDIWMYEYLPFFCLFLEKIIAEKYVLIKIIIIRVCHIISKNYQNINEMYYILNKK